MPLFLQGQIWTFKTSLHFFNSPCPITILCSMKEFTNKSMAVRWVVLSAPLSPIFAWRRSKSPQSVIHPFPPKFGKGTWTIAFASLERATSQPSMTQTNSIDANISFTIEIECNGKISFLDTLVSRRNRVIVVDVYKKPTHTDRYLDFNSHHDRQHKVSTASTLLRRKKAGTQSCLCSSGVQRLSI